MDMDGQQVSPTMKRKGEDLDDVSSKKQRNSYDDVEQVLHEFSQSSHYDPQGYKKAMEGRLPMRRLNGDDETVELVTELGNVHVPGIEDTLHHVQHVTHHQGQLSHHDLNEHHHKVHHDGSLRMDHQDLDGSMPVKRNREERRSKDKSIVRNFVCMITAETEEVEKNVPSQLHEQVGIEKNKLWELFIRFIQLSDEITSSVFWKYTYGKSRWNNTMEAPIYSNPEYHKEVLKAGVKRLSGVRWREPNSPSDRDKIQFHAEELLKIGFPIDLDLIMKELQVLLKDHDSKKPKLTRTTPSHRKKTSSIPSPTHEMQLHHAMVSQSEAGLGSSVIAQGISAITQASTVDLLTTQQAQHLIDLLSQMIQALQTYIQMQQQKQMQSMQSMSNLGNMGNLPNIGNISNLPNMNNSM